MADLVWRPPGHYGIQQARGTRGWYTLYRMQGHHRLSFASYSEEGQPQVETMEEGTSPRDLKARAQVHNDTGQLPVEQTQDRIKSLVWKQSPHIHSQVARGNRGWYHVTGVPVGGVHRVYLTPHHGANQPVTIFQGRNPQQLMRQVEVFDRTNDSPEDFDQNNNPQQAFDQTGMQVKSLRSLYRVKSLRTRTKKLNWLPDNRGEFAYSHHGVYGVSPDSENSDTHHLFYMDVNNISHAQHMRSGSVEDLKRHAALHNLSRTPKGSQNDFQRTHSS